MAHDFFSTAQLFGHATLLLSIVAFSRKHDGHFKVWLTAQNLLYAVHFFLMGNLAASAGSSLSAMRNVLSFRTRSLYVVVILLTLNFVLGFWVIKDAWNVLPLIATAIATVSMFRLNGVKLRLGVLSATLLWLVNNILTGSIGGTVMESMIAVMSSVTIYRMHRDSRRNAAQAA